MIKFEMTVNNEFAIEIKDRYEGLCIKSIEAITNRVSNLIYKHFSDDNRGDVGDLLGVKGQAKDKLVIEFNIKGCDK